MACVRQRRALGLPTGANVNRGCIRLHPDLRAQGWWTQERGHTEPRAQGLTRSPRQVLSLQEAPIVSPTRVPQSQRLSKLLSHTTHMDLALSRSHGRLQSPCAFLCLVSRAKSICSRSRFHCLYSQLASGGSPTGCWGGGPEATPGLRGSRPPCKGKTLRLVGERIQVELQRVH